MADCNAAGVRRLVVALSGASAPQLGVSLLAALADVTTVLPPVPATTS